MDSRADYKILLRRLFISFIIVIGLNIPVESGDVAGARNIIFSLGKYIVNILGDVNGNRIQLILMGVCAYTLIKTYDKCLLTKAVRVKALFFSITFAIMQMVSKDFKEDNLLNSIAGNGYNLLRGVIIYAGYAAFTYFAVGICFYYINVFFEKINKADSSEGNNIKGSWTKRYFINTIKVFLCWLPYYVLFFPGTSNYGDTEKQIRMFFHRKIGFPLNVSPLQGPDIFITDHHPYFTTYLYGGFVKLGLVITGKAYMGVALFCLLQMFLFALTLVWFWMRMESLAANKKIVRYGLIFTALFPLYPIMAACMVKDISFSFFCLTSSAVLMEIVLSKGKILEKKGFMVFSFFSLIFLMMTKGQGKYYVVAVLLIMLVSFRKYWKNIVLVFAAALMFFQFFWQGFLMSSLNISPGGKQEALGVLLQQTARYVVTYEDEVTDWEKESIDAIIPYDEITELYDPTQTNPIKLQYNQAATGADRNRYFKCWFLMLLKHPGTYFASTLNTSYKYFDIDWIQNPFFTYFNSRVDREDELFIESFFTGGALGNYISSLFLLIQRIPFIGWLIAIPFYTWGVIFMFLLSTQKNDYKRWIMWIIPLLSVLIYFACPRSLPRYSECVIYMFWPLFMMTGVLNKNMNET